MSQIRLLVVGAGGHGRSVVEAAELSGQFDVVGLLDDSLPAGDRVMGGNRAGARSQHSPSPGQCGPSLCGHRQQHRAREVVAEIGCSEF